MSRQRRKLPARSASAWRASSAISHQRDELSVFGLVGFLFGLGCRAADADDAAFQVERAWFEGLAAACFVFALVVQLAARKHVA